MLVLFESFPVVDVARLAQDVSALEASSPGVEVDAFEVGTREGGLRVATGLVTLHGFWSPVADPSSYDQQGIRTGRSRARDRAGIV